MSLLILIFTLIGTVLGYLLGETVGWEKGFNECDKIDKELIEVLKK